MDSVSIFVPVPLLNWVMIKSSMDSVKLMTKPDRIAGGEQRKHDFEQRSRGTCAEVERRFVDVGVKLHESRHDGQHDVRRTERDVGNNQLSVALGDKFDGIDIRIDTIREIAMTISLFITGS